jgi:malate synthase
MRSYGTDAMASPFFACATPPPLPASGFSQARALHVISVAKHLLDKYIPLCDGLHSAASSYTVIGHQLSPALRDPRAFVGYAGPAAAPTAVLFRHNDLHIMLRIDRSSRFGSTDAAGISDILIESSITRSVRLLSSPAILSYFTFSSIMDFEDSVACVDAQDKVDAYSVWLRLMKGSLTCEFEKAGGLIKRSLLPDMSFTSPDGSSMSVRARTLMLTRNVGLHMLTDMVKFKNKPVPENIVDSVVTIVAAMHDLLGNSLYVNSPQRCVYLVKPKLHSSAEVEFVVALTQHIESVLQLRAGAVKLMLMDEERRFSANFFNCLAAAKDRIFSTNTGFLDRTGSEFRCSCEAGPMLPKLAQRSSAWIKAYELRNVVLSAASGLLSVAQVGKVQLL